MPPNKPKLFTSSGKSTIRPLKNNISDPPSISLDSEKAQKYEVELCWCIQQLQVALNCGNLNRKQSEDYVKVLNVLMSNFAPMVKKRQIMRSTFGDYRKKMAEEEKRLSKHALHVKFKPSEPSKQSVFVKKRVFSASNNNFRFNFGNSGESSSNEIQEVEEIEQPTTDRNVFSSSDNSFRFNFGTESS